MTNQIEDQELDQLLAQPCQVADRGFTEDLKARLENSESKRTRIVFAIAICLISLLFFVSSPVEIIGFFGFSDSIWDDLLSNLVQALALQDLLRITAPENSPLLGTIFTVLLVLAITQQLGEE